MSRKKTETAPAPEREMTREERQRLTALRLERIARLVTTGIVLYVGRSLVNDGR